MKKFFTLIAAALFGAVSMNAQTEFRPGESAIEAGTVLVDNDLAKVSTVFNSNAGILLDESKKEAPVTFGGKTFKTYMQVRVNAAPSASDPVGTEQSNSTPIVIVANKNVDVTFYYRRQTQSVNDGEYYTHEQNEGKDLKLIDQAEPTKLLEASDYQWFEIDDSYGNVAKTYKLDAGHTYTFWCKGTTGRVFGFDLAAGEGSGIVAPEPAGASIPGELDLSKTTIEQGDGPELHGSAGWNGTNIDWMQTGQIAKIEFTNSKAAKYDIISYAGTPNEGVTVEFKILDAAGAEVYKEIASYVVGGWGDQTENTTLPTTGVLPAGNYTLVLTFNNPASTTTVNIYKIEFKEAAGETPAPAVGGKTIYSWKGAEAGATEVGGKAVASDGESVNYLNAGGDGTEYYTIRINKKKADIATDNVEITLDEPLQAGDEIAITGYRNKDTDANGNLYILFENGTEIDEGEEVVWNNIHPDFAQKPNTNTYAVDAAAGSKSFKIARSKSSTNVFITEIKITRGGGAAEETGRVWDFTKWSDATVANLKADAAASVETGWSDQEAADGSKVDAQMNCFWGALEANADGSLSANGVVIEELKGLVFNSEYTQQRSIAIAVNYPETSLGTYAGPSYLWLGSKEKVCFTIPQVEAGSVITMDVESHKPSDPRGLRLYAGSAEEANLLGEFKPTTLETLTWTVPATTDVLVMNTNGCHIYNIKVGDATGIEAVQAVKVAPVNNFIYNLAGQRVDANYKGVVIKNGKKYLQK